MMCVLGSEVKYMAHTDLDFGTKYIELERRLTADMIIHW